MEETKNPTLEEIVLNDLYDKHYKIPSYQRPYKWRKEHIIQLLDDLYENIFLKKEGIYRIGNIIIHQDDNCFDIVDGQQRLTTISLILIFLKSDKVLLKNPNFKDEISKNNIKFNYQLIENWFQSKSFDEKEKITFLGEIENRSQFVLITVYKQDEAFQLFDSQNSRGKSLNPHDLLKAFHLREMEKDNYSNKELENYARKWEDYILENNNQLMNVLNNYLFRIRNWSKGNRKYVFTKHDLNEFKGISLHFENKYNYQTPLRVLDGAIENAKKDRLLKNFNIVQDFPFQINMPIINGKNFFDYVYHYIEIKKDIFEFNNKDNFHQFYEQFCLGKAENKYYKAENNYFGWWRVGDQKVKNLYENICLLFIDRFGIENFEKIYFEEFYKNAYQLRLDNKSINENSVLNHVKAQRFFKLIPNSYSPEELHNELFCNYRKMWNVDSDFAKGVKPIFDFLTNNPTQNVQK